MYTIYILGRISLLTVHCKCLKGFTGGLQGFLCKGVLKLKGSPVTCNPFNFLKKIKTKLQGNPFNFVLKIRSKISADLKGYACIIYREFL